MSLSYIHKETWWRSGHCCRWVSSCHYV